jgi:hypothetical protein
MRKSLILLFLAAVGGGGSYGAGITEVARDAGMTESSTWRWHVNSILTEQQKSDFPSVKVEAPPDLEALLRSKAAGR